MNKFIRFLFLNILIYAFLGIGLAQNKDSLPNRWKLVYSSTTDDSYLENLKFEQERITEKLHNLRYRQSQLEIQRDKNEEISPLTLEDANKLQLESDFLSGEVKNLRRELSKVQSIAEKKYIRNHYGNVRYIGKSSILADDKVFANVCLINGNMIIEGKIKGDLVVINSDVFLSKISKVDGKIILINGQVFADYNYNIDDIQTGSINKDDEPYNEYAVEDNQYSYSFSYPFSFGPINHPVIRYNRVEGLYLGIKNSKNYYWRGQRSHSLYGEIGYGFANHFWTGAANLDIWSGNYTRSELGGEGHILVDSKDNWIIKEEENSFASFFLHEDFKDYYKKEGWSVHFSQYLEKSLRLRADFVSDKFESMDRNTNWALFGGDKSFRLNPKVDEGKINSTIFSLNYISVSGRDYSPTGWNIFSSYEIAKGDYEFNRILVDARRYQKLSKEIRLNGRIILGSAENNLPVQRSFDLGGLGTIPAVRFKEYTSGNRMLLGNVELMVRIPDDEEFLPFEIFNGSDLVVFYDAGVLRYIQPEKGLFDGFENIKSDEVISDIGAALSFHRGSVRIGASFRLDKKESAKLFLRLTQPF